MTGTVLAQVIQVSLVPILSRLYSPAMYGVFGVYLSLVGILGCLTTFRYSTALILPKEDRDAASLLWLCGCITLLVTILAGMVCLIFGTALGSLLKCPDLIPWLWTVPLSVLFIGTWFSLTAWTTRRKQFHRTSISQVTRALTGPGSQIAAALYRPSVWGLILGCIIGDGFASIVLATQVFKEDWPLIRSSCCRKRIWRLAKEFAAFPVYATPRTLLNTVSQYLPSLFFAHYFGVVVVGYYAFGVRILQLPVGLVANSLTSVLLQKGSEVHNAKGDTYTIFKKTTLGLILISIVPSVVLILFAPMLAAFVLGAEWYMAGEYARWLTIWLAIFLCSAPAEQFAQIYRRQRSLLVLESTLLITRVVVLIVGGTYCTATQTVIMYSVVGAAFSTYMIVWVWCFLKEESLATNGSVAVSMPPL